MATPIIPVKNLSTQDILYGDRTTQYRWEVLEHSNGVDQLVGVLDGVKDGDLSWTQNAAVKGRGKVKVADLPQAQPGMLKISDLALESARLRPVMTMNGDDFGGQYTDVWTEQRRNLIQSPIPGGWGGYAGAGGTWTGATVTDARFSGSSARRLTWTVASTALGYLQFPQALQTAIGTTYLLSMRYSMTGQSITPIIALGGGTPPIYTAIRGVVDHGDGTVTAWLLATITGFGSGTGNCQPILCSWGTVSAGGVLLAGNALIEKRSDFADYFDGGTSAPTPYIRYRWLGTTNASMSVAELRTSTWVPNSAPVIPDIPWGTFLVTQSGEDWDETGRVLELELLDRCTVPSQDEVDQSYSVVAGTNILQEVRAILATCNEYIVIDEAVALATLSGMAWEAGTSKLKIINDLLDVAGYNALWMDGWGNLQTTPRVLPADRSIIYELLGFPRELVDGEKAIYQPDWTRAKDSFKVPNKVIAVQAAGGEDQEALVGTWTNEDPDSPYSYQSRGRWITQTLDSVECPDGTDLSIVAFLQNRARTYLIQASAVQAQVKITHLPIPVRVSDVLRFANAKAGIDTRHVITGLELSLSPLGLMKSTLQEVVTL